MTNTSFLEKIAETVIHNYSDSLSTTIIVLPNKRAKVFLIDALKKQINSPVFLPEILSIEDLVQKISGLRLIDPIELIFEFYEVYLKLPKNSEVQSFEVFANWGKTLLQDFNEIDRYLLDPSKILTYLDNIKEIEHWSLNAEARTELITKHLEFWKLLPTYYTSFYKYLLEEKKGYQGMIYREAVLRIEQDQDLYNNKNILFAGFNALNAAEEIIIQHLLVSNQAKIYWDIDESLLQDASHDAGLFVRKYKNNWKYYKSNPFEWVSNDFSKSKEINIIGTPKSVGQAKITASIIEKINLEKPENDLNKVVIVLAEENLLVPLLYSLPESVQSLNITMGYSSKNNPAQILVEKLFRMHINAINRKGNSYVFYFKDVLDVLNHPMIEPYVDGKNLARTINTYNYSFISHDKLFELQKVRTEVFNLIFEKWEGDVNGALNKIVRLLQEIKEGFNNDNEEEKIAKTFLYSIFKTINKLITYSSHYQHMNSLPVLFSVYKQIIDLAEVSFEGEPLNGLQVMGILESRVLDFETVIITFMNEGKFPAGKSNNSFIPYDVKKEYGLPTFKEKDAIYSYHFYHILQRAKNVFLIYNTESEGLDAGEKSRFITQLEIEPRPNHTLSHEIYNAILPEVAYQPKVIAKSEAVMARLNEIATKGFSPSSLTSYIRNPIDFYFQKILRIREVEEVEESIAVNTLGTIIHETLKTLYKPYEGKFLSEFILQSFLKESDDEVLRQFKLIYKEGEIKKGRNLLAFEVAKRHVQNFVRHEQESIKQGIAIKIIAIEKTYERLLEHSDLPIPILIKGNVDRIDERDGVIRIIDYKTGKVEKGNVKLKAWDGLTLELNNDKIIQILSYAYMFFEEAKGKDIEAGIISFKNLKSGFLPFTFKGENDESSTINDEVISNFIHEIVILLKEIFNTEVPFEEKLQ
jgi:hypothetical protein